VKVLGFGFRKSLNLGGGIRLNLGKKGIGISAGVKGFRVGIGPSGSRMRATIPGTGLYYEERLGNKSKSKSIQPSYEAPQPVTPKAIKLGFFQRLTTPDAEIVFTEGTNQMLKGQKESALANFRDVILKDRHCADAYFAIALLSTDDAEQLAAIKYTLSEKAKYGSLFSKYKVAMGGSLDITNELKMQITNDDLGLILVVAEIYQENNLHSAAISLLENSSYLDQPAVLLSLGELYYDAGKFEESIKTLQKLDNNDQVGTTSLLYQGLAFREIKQFAASAEVLKAALRRKKGRSQELLLEARYQLACTYELAGEFKKAKKEYEKILTEDFEFRDVKDKVKALAC
jgi:tetratricopeptide (TPR) repeat protein